jgi:hypothetical protein
MMMDDFTHNILQSMKGYLDITVTVPGVAGRLTVVGATSSALRCSWEGMPPEMKVDRAVYCCRPAWDEARGPVFVFADDVTVVDAPAYLVVGRMMDRMYERGLDIDRMMNDEDEDNLDDEDPNGDWGDTSAELR